MDRQTLAEVYKSGIAKYHQYLQQADEVEFDNEKEYKLYKEELANEWFEFEGFSDLQSDITDYVTELTEQILEECVNQRIRDTPGEFEAYTDSDAMYSHVIFSNVYNFYFPEADKLISKWIEKENLQSVGKVEWNWYYNRGEIELELIVFW